MLRINIVYQNKNMPSDILPPFEAADGSYIVTWSRMPQPGSDAVVYFNHYTFDQRCHDQVCPEALKVLYMYEPPAIDPIQYTRRVWKQFDELLTWNTYLTESSPAFTFEAGAYFDLPYCSDYGVEPLSLVPVATERERAICQICGDKYSLSKEEIYSERRNVARWFDAHGETRMDVFGRPPMQVPNYRGVSEDKAETLSKYRYALCFENTFDPCWTRGYLTEKILDCMSCGTIPIYYGCSDIEKLVPEDCFIDYRAFAELDELDCVLQKMSDAEYSGYVDRMRVFLEGYNAHERHSVFRLYETLVRLLSKPRGEQPDAQFPSDYLQMNSFAGKLRFYVMRLLLPYHKWVYSMFSLMRAVTRLFRFRKK